MSPYSLNGNSEGGIGVKNEKAEREFEDRNRDFTNTPLFFCRKTALFFSNAKIRLLTSNEDIKTSTVTLFLSQYS